MESEIEDPRVIFEDRFVGVNRYVFNFYLSVIRNA